MQSVHSEGEVRWQGLGTLALCWLLVSLPPWLVERYPPILDLPMLLEQAQRLEETARGTRPELAIQLASPNKLAYAVVLPAWWLGGPALAPRLVAWAVASALLLGCAWALRRWQQPPEHLLWCVPWIWSGSYHVGLFHFLLGLLVGLLWLEAVLRADAPLRSPLGHLLRGLGLGAGLYLAHALWLLWGAAVLLASGLWRRSRWRQHLALGAGLAPFLGHGFLWYPRLERQGWAGGWLWTGAGAERWAGAEPLASHLLGAQRGWIEPLLAAAAVLYWTAGWWHERARGGGQEDGFASFRRGAAGVGLATILWAVFGPESVGDTALFSRRWGWVGGILLTLSTPPWGQRSRMRLLAGLLVALLSSGTTALAWERADRIAGRPLARVLERLGPGERVLGLDRYGPPANLWVPVFRHAAAYAALERGAEPGFSFAEVPTSLVTYRNLPVTRPWTPWLHNAPGRLRARDLAHFDWILVAGRPDRQLQFGATFGLQPVVQEGIWTLWRGGRVRAPESPAQSPPAGARTAP